MTEPEEIDEDLFADLYEGDEPTKTTESINPLPEKYAEPAAPPIADPEPFNESVMPDAPPDTGPPPDEEVIRSQLPENDGYTGHGWNDNASPSRRDSIADNDTHGIGIKEDG
ncbi:MAG: hypothetical protein LQ340_003745 [Diploschistes diacapsis]|nr:MAG: hypothetical protein LQ340_003745 [Diploschistes diacapsis]